MDDQQLGARVRFVRQLRGWNQSRLAQHCGWSAAKLSKMETGKQALTALQLAELAAAMDVPITFLLSLPTAGPLPDDLHLLLPMPPGDEAIRLTVTVRHTSIEIACGPLRHAQVDQN
jgi:transcriptional regulator with XRE-family HTH domain